MSAKSTAPDLAGYRAWLQARECSAGTVEKYLRDVARFFAEAEAQSPAPKEAVAGWRDALAARGYAPSSVNAMLAAVNAYQTFSGNPQGRARPLKCQRRVFCEARRELSRRRGVQAGPVFTGRGGQPLGRITVWKMLKALCEPAGVEKDKVFPHNLRHLFARTFYGVEKNLSKLADLLGHSSVETTRIYIMESGAEHQKLLSACTCCCKATKVCFCCRTHAGYITEGSRSGRFAPPRSIKKTQQSCWADDGGRCPTALLRLFLGKTEKMPLICLIFPAGCAKI